MKASFKYLYLIIILIPLGCKKPYNPPAITAPISYLVVEGTIESAPDSTVFKISKTVNLSSKITSNPVDGATVTIESSANDVFPLTQMSSGKYEIYGLNLSSALKYRLRIKTGQDEYLSDFVPVLNSPPIDSIDYVVADSGITLSANTHDPTNVVRYFRWAYNETWEFHSNFDSGFYSNGDTVLERSLQDQIYTCWRSDTSNDIVLGSSAKLSHSIISGNPIISIASTSEKLSVEYSIFVKQYALSGDAYTFWQNLKKNTEQLGSIFDAQPSQINGNIHCVNNPAQPVIGYISAGATSTKRIFIHTQQLPNWPPPPPTYTDCVASSFLYVFYPAGVNTSPVNQVDQYINYNKEGGTYIPIAPISRPGGPILGYTASTPECVDCTLRGSNKQPSFWK